MREFSVSVRTPSRALRRKRNRAIRASRKEALGLAAFIERALALTRSGYSPN